MTDNSRFRSKMPWRPLPNIVHAVCVRHFDGSGADDLTLQLGDQVYITEVTGQENQWCRGWLLAHPSVTNGLTAQPDESLRPRAYAGIFPRRCVHIREVLSDSEKARTKEQTIGPLRGHARTASAPLNGNITNGVNHSPTSSSGANNTDRKTPSPPMRYDSPQAPLVPKDVEARRRSYPKEPAPLPALRVGNPDKADTEPLVEDISSSIKDWHSAKLHSLALQKDYKTLEELSALVDRLTDARRQLAHNFLTEKELWKLREQVVWDLVRGNKMVDGEVIVRDAAQKGRTLTAQDSLPELLELQAVMSLRDRPIPSSAKEPHLSHLLMDVKAVPQQLGDPALLLMYLCAVTSSGRPKTVSEAFAVELAIEESSGRVEVADDIAKTLFSELNKIDVGGGDESDSRLFLVCKLIRDEPMHRAKSNQTSTPNSPNPQQTKFDESGDESGRSRRSLMGRRSRRNSESNDRPRTSGSMRSVLQRSSSQNRTGQTNGTQVTELDPTRRTRRVAGWCAVSISSLIRNQASERLSVSFWAPAMPLDPIAQPVSGQDGWNDILKLLVRTPSGSFSKAAIGSLTLDLMAFANDDVNNLIRDKPALLRDIHTTPALSLNGGSKLPRSDIYLTLRGPILPSRARTYHPQFGSVPINAETDLMNLQVTLEVRTNDGRRIEDAIHPTANRKPHTAFRSPAVERGEAWNQTIRLSIPPRDVPNCHVIMSIADGSQFPFALAWIPLWDRVSGFPPDGPQNLALWDYCEYTANTIDGKGAYQSLPAHADEMKEQSTPQMSTIAVETHLSSTSATQNADVLALSNLERIEMENLGPLLERFQSIPDEEIAKFFGPILVSLDYVLEQCSDLENERNSSITLQTNRECSDLAVRCLAHTARLIRDRRFPHLEGLLNEYIARRRPSIEGRLGILRTLRSLLSKPFDARGGRELRACLKVTDVLLKFALHRDSAEEDKEEDPFSKVQREVSELFEDLTVLLSNNNHLALPTQVIIVQNFHTWLPETLPMCSEDDTVRFASSAADACATNRSSLWLHRLSMIHNLFTLEKFKTPSLRGAIIDKTEIWLEPVWPAMTDVDETDLASLRLCCTILKEQQSYMDHAQAQRYVRHLFNAFYMIEQSGNGSNYSASRTKAVRFRRKNFSPMFPTSYPFRSVSTQAPDVPVEVLLEISAVLGTFFQPGSAVATVQPGANLNGTGAAGKDAEFSLDDADLAKALFVVRSIQQNGAFPDSWLSLAVSFGRCQVSILDYLLDHLQQSLPNTADDPEGDAILDFDGALWQHWFDALIALVTSDVVGMENHSEQKRRAVWTIGGDIRELAAGLLKRAWDALGWDNDEETEAKLRIQRMGGYQVQFTSTLIPAVVGLGLSLHSGLRAVAIEVLRSMIAGEWELSGNLDVVKSAFADALDAAFRDAKFEPSQAKLLLDSLNKRLAYLKDTGADPLHAAVVEMLAEIQSLIEMLSNVHNAGHDLPASQLEQRVRLLEHLKTTNNEDSYLRHIHDVAEAQVENKNYSSAALAMELHLAILKQRTGPTVDMQLAKPYPELQLPSQTIYQRRQMLYAAMIKYFRLGCCWSKVLDTLEEQRQELVASYDSANLSTVLRDQSETYHKLSTGKGLFMPRFFKVTFSNMGFPASVLGKSFIYEAAPEDDTGRFARRMKHLYPMATVVHSGVTTSNAATDAPKIHIISVNVNRDQLNPINLRCGVSPFYRLYHLSSNPDTFSNSTRQQKPGISVAEQTVAKTVYTTDEKFPTLLGRAEIIKEEALILSPIQAAIDRTHRKTMDIAEVLMNANMTDTSENDKLVQIIRSSVDPASMDSVAAYHELLLDESTSNLPSQRSSVPVPPSSPARAISSIPPSSPTAAHSDLPNAPPIPPSDSEAAATRKKSLVRVLTTALQDHALTIEQALASAFDYRLTIKSKLRDHLEETFEPELYGLYPDASWRQNSLAWRDALPPPKTTHPGMRSSLMEGITMSGGMGGLAIAEPLRPVAENERSASGTVGRANTTAGFAPSSSSGAAPPGSSNGKYYAAGSRQVSSSSRADAGSGTKQGHRRYESAPVAGAGYGVASSSSPAPPSSSGGAAYPPPPMSAGYPSSSSATNGVGPAGVSERDYAGSNVGGSSSVSGYGGGGGAYSGYGSAVESETETQRGGGSRAGSRQGHRRKESAAGRPKRRLSFLSSSGSRKE